jgi:cytidylate kinase
LQHKSGGNVRIIAPVEIRVKRIMKSEGLNKMTPKLIEDNDKAQAEYLHRFYNINWEDPLFTI